MQNHIFRYQPLHRPHYRRSVAAWESGPFWRRSQGANCLRSPNPRNFSTIWMPIAGSGSRANRSALCSQRGTILFSFFCKKCRKIVDKPIAVCYNLFRRHGGVAHLGERLNGIQEVVGSIPIISTRKKSTTSVVLFCFIRQGRFWAYFAPLSGCVAGVCGDRRVGSGGLSSRVCAADSGHHRSRGGHQ